MSDYIKYQASKNDADVLVRLVQAREQLKDCLLRGLAPIGYWQVQIHDDAIALIASQASEIAARDAEIERLRSDNTTLRADAAQWKGRYWWYVRSRYKATEGQYARLLVEADAAIRGEKP